MGERNYIVHNLEALLDFNRALHKQRDSGQRDLFGSSTVSLAPPKIRLQDVAPASREERLAGEKELLGLYITEHPLSELQGELKHITTPLSELSGLSSNASAKVRAAGVITRIKKIITKSQQPMLFVQLEDMVGKVEVLVFPSLLSKTGTLWEEGAKVLIEGKISDKDGEIKILIDRAWILTKDIVERFRPQQPEKVVIRLPRTFSRTHLAHLQQLLARYHTNKGIPVELLVPRAGRQVLLPTLYRWPRTISVTTVLAPVVGRESVHLQ
jgi:DNA polymerase-3 subunit alpha